MSDFKLPEWYRKQAQAYIDTIWSHDSTAEQIARITREQRIAEGVLAQIRNGVRRDVPTSADIMPVQTSVSARVTIPEKRAMKRPSILSNQYQRPTLSLEPRLASSATVHQTITRVNRGTLHNV